MEIGEQRAEGLVMIILEEASERANTVPYCEEMEAEEMADRFQPSPVHNLLVRASVREAMAMIDLFTEWRNRGD